MEVLTVISNAALLIAAYIAFKKRRIFRAPTIFTEAFVSSLYHLCDYSGHCLFQFQTLHYFDFFFAELLVVLAGLYLIWFEKDYEWVEWIMIFIYICAIVVLQVVLPGELYVQGGLIGSLIIVLITYWCIFGIPKYDWYYLTIGTIFLSISAILFSYQSASPDGYWAIHSLWHLFGAIGISFIFYTKESAELYRNAANKII